MLGSVSQLQLLAGNLSQLLVLVVLKNVPGMMVPDVNNEVVLIFVAQLRRDRDETFVDVGDPPTESREEKK